MPLIAGYRSQNLGRQDLSGTAIERIANATDNNNAEKIDNVKWWQALLKNRLRMDKIHERLFQD
jgi:hypothetical protein